MTSHDESTPIVARSATPEHGPSFWADLDAAMREVDDPTAEMPSTATTTATTNRPPVAHRPRRFLPLAAAAMLIAVVGLGALFLNGRSSDTVPTEVVAGQTAADPVVPLDGPDGDDGQAADESTSAVPDDETAAETDGGEATGVAAETVVPGTGTADGDSGDSAALAPVADHSFAKAPGATGDLAYLPLDGRVPADSTFLGTWDERAVSFYGVTDPSSDCNDLNYAEIRYVNGSGLTQSIRDPQLRFSGNISHLTIRTEQNYAAWLVSCGAQLELFTATLDHTGAVLDLDLVWFGEGSASSALILWEADEVSLNAIDPKGTPFSVAYNLASEVVSRNGGPSRIMIEATAPARRQLTPLAASADATFSYWAGAAPAGEAGACGGPLQGGSADTLWIRQGEGRWQPAVVDGTLVGWPTAVAIEPEFSQIAFADRCDGSVGRVFIGTQRGDGRISSLREIDLEPFVPGYAAALFWVDATTLRIETDNREYGFGTVRFDFRFDDGRDQGVIVQLD